MIQIMEEMGAVKLQLLEYYGFGLSGLIFPSPAEVFLSN